MPEKEPLYFKEFRTHIDKKFEEVDKKFEEVKRELKSDIDSLAISTAKGFREMDFRFDTLENRIERVEGSIEKIEGHIGRYEIRAQNIEQILLQDFKPRIKALEKIVLA